MTIRRYVELTKADGGRGQRVGPLQDTTPGANDSASEALAASSQLATSPHVAREAPGRQSLGRQSLSLRCFWP
jgi:hypothetical protein